MRAQHLAGPALIAAALLAAIPLSQTRSDAPSSGAQAAAQPDNGPSTAPTTP